MVVSDAELVGLAGRGDAASLGILLERHRAPLYALALRMLGHGPEAQDAVHDAFLIALRKVDQLHDPDSVGAWLRAIVHNACVSRLRKRRGEVLFDEVPRYIERRSAESSAEEAIDRLAMREWVWTALSELPESLRVTAMLRYFGTYASYEEISRMLGVPVGTVRSRLNQVKIKLAEALLATAGLDHSEARRVTETETLFFQAAWDEYNRGEGYELFASKFSGDPSFVRSGGISRGRGWLVKELEGDLEAGMKMRLTNILASKDVTIIEGDFENPPDDPFHCPPSTSQIYFYRDGRIDLMHEYFAPRPERQYETIGQKP